jgi:hypothetical protein
MKEERNINVSRLPLILGYLEIIILGYLEIIILGYLEIIILGYLETNTRLFRN